MYLKIMNLYFNSETSVGFNNTHLASTALGLRNLVEVDNLIGFVVNQQLNFLTYLAA